MADALVAKKGETPADDPSANEVVLVTRPDEA
jgi:hypothetical protein